eukprot:3340385-Karenia_brevis.AAC.1
MSIQKLLVKDITPRIHAVDLVKLLHRSFQRWEMVLPDGARAAAERVPALLEEVSRCAPPAVLSAWLHTALNGWSTARRFQEVGLCRLSTECTGEDSIEHYSVCPHAWSCARR